MSDDIQDSDFAFIFPRKLIIQFIQLYKENPCLWDRNNLYYKHKSKRHEAVSKLTALVQEYDPSATRVHVLKKIESMRACVRREYNKIESSRKKATCAEEVHTPHLWYYDLLSFVFGEDGNNYQYQPRADRSPHRTSEEEQKSEFSSLQIVKIQSQDSEEEPADDDSHNYHVPMEPYPVVEYNNTSNVGEHSDSSMSKQFYDEDSKSAKRHCTEIEDEYDAIGINVAAKLRFLPSNMRILAEKLINDVLFQAQMNALNSSTCLSTSDPFKQEQTII